MAITKNIKWAVGIVAAVIVVAGLVVLSQARRDPAKRRR